MQRALHKPRCRALGRDGRGRSPHKQPLERCHYPQGPAHPTGPPRRPATLRHAAADRTSAHGRTPGPPPSTGQRGVLGTSVVLREYEISLKNQRLWRWMRGVAMTRPLCRGQATCAPAAPTRSYPVRRAHSCPSPPRRTSPGYVSLDLRISAHMGPKRKAGAGRGAPRARARLAARRGAGELPAPAPPGIRRSGGPAPCRPLRQTPQGAAGARPA